MGERRVIFITHAEVVIDPRVRVNRWKLSERGRARHKAFNADPAVADVRAVWSSLEVKAREGADILAKNRSPFVVGNWAPKLEVGRMKELGENDRSATGYLPKAEFEATADLFFAHPETSIRGWERAVDAQARIVAAVETIRIYGYSQGDIAIVSHGGVGALLLAHLSGAAISRAWDQPGGGGGNWFSFGAESGQLLTGWQSIGA